MNCTFSSPMGEFPLSLDSSDPSLRPFDAADEFLLNRVKEAHSDALKILTVNDSQGGITVPLAGRTSAMVQDSFRDRSETAANLKHNGCGQISSTPLLELESSSAELILMKIPKSVDYFRFQLRGLASRIQSETPLMAGGMSRYLPAAFFEAVNEFCRDASYSRIVKKARIYEGILSPLPYEAETSGRSFDYAGSSYMSLPGVFSHGKLDSGTRFLLNYVKSPEGKNRLKKAAGGTIADPGCGCGILGLEGLKALGPKDVIFSDDNAMALASTRANAAQAGAEPRCRLLHTNVLDGVEEGSVDLVLCNPPFHRGHSIALDTGFSFIRESARILKPGGQALFVVNRTLGYGNIMNENFTTAASVGENSGYRLILCRK